MFSKDHMDDVERDYAEQNRLDRLAEGIAKRLSPMRAQGPTSTWETDYQKRLERMRRGNISPRK